MDIVIDFSSIYEFLSLSPDLMMWRIFVLVGWIPIAITFLWGMKEVWLQYIRRKWKKENARYILLAIDIPRGNEQSPRAVENMFSYLAGAHASINLIEKYWNGREQLSFSCEIVSLEGYTQFLIHTPIQFRNLVESSIYSQYPDAEITEVDDYTEDLPSKFPDEEYDIWGTEFIQRNNPVYPIKIYKDFEHQLGPPETHYKDPMASLMDLCSSLRKGEQLWYQIIITPIGFDWPEEGEKEISRVLGEKTGDNIFDKIINTILKWMGDFSELIYKLWGDIEAEEKKEDDTRFRMMNLKPREKKQIEAIQDKISKLGFEFKIRMVYLAKKEVLNKAKVANGFVGYMKQFASLDLNNIKPDTDITMTKVDYFFKEFRLNIRKNRIFRYYKKRDDSAGRKRGIFNVEELASIWHFPVESVVKAPLIQKAPGRKAEPPMQLPVGEEIISEEILAPIFIENEKKNNLISNKEKIEKKGTPPVNLPMA